MKKNSSTRDLIGVEKILKESILTRNGEIVFFMIYPTNLTVLSYEDISAKIYSLMNVIKFGNELELICINSRENFDNNKKYLKTRIEEEENVVIRNLLLQDVKNLDEIQINLSTAREFLIAIKYKNTEKKDINTYLLQMGKNIKEQGFRVKKADKDDIKRILSVYFEQNITTEKFEDYDGDRWVIFGDN